MLTKQEFISILHSIPPSIAPHQAGEREMRNVELFFICQQASLVLQPGDLIFESGVWKGRSSAILAAFAMTKRCNVISCCSDRNQHVEAVEAHFPNLAIIYGRGEKHLPSHDPQVVIADGPKANKEDGVTFLTDAAEKQSVKIVFQHDVGGGLSNVNFMAVAKAHGKSALLILKTFLAENSDLDADGFQKQLLGMWTLFTDGGNPPQQTQ